VRGNEPTVDRGHSGLSGVFATVVDPDRAVVEVSFVAARTEQVTRVGVVVFRCDVGRFHRNLSFNSGMVLIAHAR
jgi:hypothetical protein